MNNAKNSSLPIEIKPLIVHPPPEIGESVGKWIERLAKANNTRFNILFRAICEYAKYFGLSITLSLLTRVSAETISHMETEFKDHFWNDVEIIFWNSLSKMSFSLLKRSEDESLDTKTHA